MGIAGTFSPMVQQCLIIVVSCYQHVTPTGYGCMTMIQVYRHSTPMGYGLLEMLSSCSVGAKYYPYGVGIHDDHCRVECQQRFEPDGNCRNIFSHGATMSHYCCFLLPTCYP